MKNKSQKILIGIILLIIISLPYIIAINVTGEKNQFGGFLLNPKDGNSYLAKMNEGYSGEWLFTLPYTAGHSDGVFLFEFYLFLGHLAHWLNLPILVIYHLSRVISTAIFFITLFFFLTDTIRLSEDKLIMTVILICFGSGLGWVLFLLGVVTSDFLVSEAYPFLSAYSTPHFILGMALFLLILMKMKVRNKKNPLILWILGILLSIVMPFAAIIAGIIFACNEIWNAYGKRKIQIIPFLSIILGAGISIVFQYFQTINDPLLAVWNTQNITLTPPIWDLLISFSPSLPFAILGVIQVIKNRNDFRSYQVLLIWLITTSILVMFPFSLQRRFLFGIFIPIAILAVEGICVLTKGITKKTKFVFFTFFLISVITNIFIILSGISFVKSGNQTMVISKDESNAFSWILSNTNQDDIILSSPALGNFIPAHTGRQVLYGHEYETANAEVVKASIDSFYSNTYLPDEQTRFLTQNHIRWIIEGPRELEIGFPVVLQELEKVYENQTVRIYEVIYEY